MEDVKKSQGYSRVNEIKWKAPEYVFHEKTVDWYWWFGTVAVFLIGFAIYSGNWLFVAVILIGGFSMLLYAVKPPRVVEYSATLRGISHDKKMYPYQSIDHFYIDVHPDDDKENLLLVHLKSMTEPLLIIPLGDAPIDELEDFLLDFIEEKQMSRPAGQLFMEILGF